MIQYVTNTCSINTHYFWEILTTEAKNVFEQRVEQLDYQRLWYTFDALKNSKMI